MYHPPHFLVSGNELVGAGTGLVAPLDSLRLTEEPESISPPGGLDQKQSAQVSSSKGPWVTTSGRTYDTQT